ncbi:hypothetical protein [Luteimicrobium album]|uniref:hypothetical protein n=1 Tax=Luteimicrobium album TaxID=1054550 RepID=UPI0032AFD4C7
MAARLATPFDSTPGMLLLRDLDPEVRYRVRVVRGADGREEDPSGGVVVPGRVLMTTGLRCPTLRPGDLAIVELTAR